MSKNKTKISKRIFIENPYDIETLFESLTIAANSNKELLYMDKLISYIRLDPQCDLTNVNYNILRDLDLISLEKLK